MSLPEHKAKALFVFVSKNSTWEKESVLRQTQLLQIIHDSGFNVEISADRNSIQFLKKIGEHSLFASNLDNFIFNAPDPGRKWVT